MLIEIIRDQRFHMGRKLANILLNLKIESVPHSMQIEFCKVLQERLTFIVSNGGNPQFIASLVIQNKEIFEVLALVPNNGLTETQKLFYEINTGCGDWNQVITDQVETARQQFEVNKNPGTYTGFFEKPYATIKSIVRKNYTSKMAEVINRNLLPLCIEVLTSQAPADIKKIA